jgi:transcriptional regulator with XRE-family HTH domain
MSLFFDADWFDARLAELGLDRADLAIAVGLDRAELHRLFINERAPSADELNAFATVLQSDLLEVTLRSGVAARAPNAEAEDANARIESIEARLDALDTWIAEFEDSRKRA